MRALHRLIQRHAQASAWLLVWALLLSALWGQTHRVLHPGATTPQAVAASAEAGSQAAVAGLADEDGSGLCKLLDQLALGAGVAVALQAPLWPSQPCAMQATAPALPTWGADPRRFDARGPPAAA